MEETAKVYLDSSIFLTVFLGTQELSKKSEHILDLVKNGKLNGFTSTLTYDEVFWKVKKMRSRQEAIGACEIFLNFPNLKFIESGLEVIWAAHKLLQKYEIAPRDAIHAATALHKNCVMLSHDVDFEKIKELRLNLLA